MHITPPVTAEGYDGSHHPRYAECSMPRFDRYVFLECHLAGDNATLDDAILFLASAWLAKPKATVIIYWNFNPLPHIYGDNRGKLRITLCKAYQCA